MCSLNSFYLKMMLPKWPKKSPSILATFVRKVVAQSGHTGILLPISERGFVAKKVNDKKAKLKKKLKKAKLKQLLLRLRRLNIITISIKKYFGQKVFVKNWIFNAKLRASRTCVKGKLNLRRNDGVLRYLERYLPVSKYLGTYLYILKIFRFLPIHFNFLGTYLYILKIFRYLPIQFQNTSVDTYFVSITSPA